MTSFLCLYRGETIGTAKVVAVSAEPELVRAFAQRMLAAERDDREEDPALRELGEGRRRALLRLVDREPE